MRKCFLAAACLVLALFWMYKPVYAAETEMDFNGAWEKYGLDKVSEGLESMVPDYELDVQEIWKNILQGKIIKAIGLLWEGIKEKIFSEIAGMKNIFASILILGIISAFFANFSDVFQNHQIADISFYFLYLILMAVLMKSFLEAAEITGQAVGNIVLFIKMYIPAYFMAVGAAAGAATGAAYYQLTLVLAYGVERILQSVLIPLIYSYVLLSLMNGIWAEERLTLLLDFVKKVIGAGLKAAMGAITSFSLFQSVITPVIDSLHSSMLKKAVGAIPGIGNLAEGITEMVIGSAVLIKNSIGLLMLFILLAMCLLPLVKLLLIACMMKGSAALAGIVSDKRITGCTDRVGDGSLLLFKTAFTAVALFMITIAVAAYTSGRG